MRVAFSLPLTAGLALVALAGCTKGPVEWADPIPIDAPAAMGSAKLVLDTAGQARFVSGAVGAQGAPEAPGLCKSSLTMASGPSRLYAAWWSVRPDSSAVLNVASSPDSGKTWARTLAVDTTDVSSSGCNRPPPSVTTVGDDVYLAYSMIAPEGKGVFFAHSMGFMLHSPVPVIYGDRLVPTAIQADSLRVAVAYEDPNGKREQIAVAFSGSQGHQFEMHATASRDVDIAGSPAVAFAGPMIAVSWLTRRPMDSTTTRVVRVGRMLPW